MENNEENIWENYKKPEESDLKKKAMEYAEEKLKGYDSKLNQLVDEMGQFPGHKGNSFELTFNEKYDKPQEINGVTWKSMRKIK